MPTAGSAFQERRDPSWASGVARRLADAMGGVLQQAVVHRLVIDGRISSLGSGWARGPPRGGRRRCSPRWHRAAPARPPHAPGRFPCPRGIDSFSRLEIAQRLAGPDMAQHIGRDGCRNNARRASRWRRRRQSTPRRCRGGHQPNTAAQGGAMDPGDGGFFESARVRSMRPGRGHRRDCHRRLGGGPLHPLEVRPGGKLLPRPPRTTTRTAGSASSTVSLGRSATRFRRRRYGRQGGSSTAWQRS